MSFSEHLLQLVEPLRKIKTMFFSSKLLLTEQKFLENCSLRLTKLKQVPNLHNLLHKRMARLREYILESK